VSEAIEKSKAKNLISADTRRRRNLIAGLGICLALVLTCVCLVLSGTASLSLLVNGVIYGIINGFLYTLIALGMTLLFGMMGIINFAHGAIYMLGAFVVYYFFGRFGLNYYAVLVLAGIFLAAFGYVVERGIYHPLRKNPNAVLVALLGLNILLGSGAYLVFGIMDKTVPSVFHGVINIGLVNISVERLAILPFALVLLLSLYLLLYRTRFGQAMRASSQDRDAAALQGVNVQFINGLAFGVSFALAGVAGALIAPLGAITPAMGFRPLFISFIIIILGGLGSLRGAIFAALLVGLVESIGTVVFGADMAYLFLFVFIFVLLIFRPEGLFGHAQ